MKEHLKNSTAVFLAEKPSPVLPESLLKVILAFENATPARFSDIFSDRSASDVFLVDGDSLLIEILSDPSLDLQHGAQTAHATFLFERMLNDLASRDSVCHLVFFEAAAGAYSQLSRHISSTIFLLRQALIRHCSADDFAIPTHLFRTWDSDEWRSYLAHYNPSFLIAHCEAPTSLKATESLVLKKMGLESSSSAGPSSSSAGKQSVDTALSTFRFFSTLVFDFLTTQHRPVCDIASLQFDQHINGHLLDPDNSFKRSREFAAHIPALSAWVGTQLATAEQVAALDTRTAELADTQNALVGFGLLPYVVLGLRKLVSSGSLGDADLDIARLVTFSVTLQERIPLRLRAVDFAKLNSSSEKAVASGHAILSFLSSLSRSMLPLLANDLLEADESGTQHPIVDIMDGRLIHCMSRLLVNAADVDSLAAPESVATAAQTAWNLITTGIEKLDGTAPLFPFSSPSVSLSEAINGIDSSVPAPIKLSPELTELEDPLLVEYFGTMFKSVVHKERKFDSFPFKHILAPESNPLRFLAEGKNPRKTYAEEKAHQRVIRQFQKQLAFFQQYAISLEETGSLSNQKNLSLSIIRQQQEQLAKQSGSAAHDRSKSKGRGVEEDMATGRFDRALEQIDADLARLKPAPGQSTPEAYVLLQLQRIRCVHALSLESVSEQQRQTLDAVKQFVTEFGPRVTPEMTAVLANFVRNLDLEFSDNFRKALGHGKAGPAAAFARYGRGMNTEFESDAKALDEMHQFFFKHSPMMHKRTPGSAEKSTFENGKRISKTSLVATRLGGEQSVAELANLIDLKMYKEALKRADSIASHTDDPRERIHALLLKITCIRRQLEEPGLSEGFERESREEAYSTALNIFTEHYERDLSYEQIQNLFTQLRELEYDNTIARFTQFASAVPSADDQSVCTPIPATIEAILAHVDQMETALKPEAAKGGAAASSAAAKDEKKKGSKLKPGMKSKEERAADKASAGKKKDAAPAAKDNKKASAASSSSSSAAKKQDSDDEDEYELDAMGRRRKKVVNHEQVIRRLLACGEIEEASARLESCLSGEIPSFDAASPEYAALAMIRVDIAFARYLDSRMTTMSDLFEALRRNFYTLFSSFTGNSLKALCQLANELQLPVLAAKVRMFRIRQLGALPQLPPSSSRKKMSDIQYQLKCQSRFMPRQVPALDDSRVKFKAELWQSELMNSIDKRRSVLVSAPTSAGKTFVSYYTIEKVISESDDDVVVYIAPTRALVNQAVAEIHRRFKKNYDNPARTLWGAFNWGTSIESLRCQVLVTDPQHFDILLMSPQFSAWAKRLKYVIFDEVHQLHESFGGSAWEHLLLAIPCPFVALSATLGNAQDFVGWLDKVVSSCPEKKGQLDVIIHRERYSDLKYHFYEAGAPSQAAGSIGASLKELAAGPGKMMPITSIAALNASNIAERGFPRDMVLLPEDAALLYDQMITTLRQEQQATPDAEVAAELNKLASTLSPELYFAPYVTITRQLARKYEVALKDILLAWSRSDNAEWQKRADRVLGALRAPFESSFSAMEATWDAMDFNHCKANIYPLVRTLHAANLLPTLVFHLEPSGCLDLMRSLVPHLRRISKASMVYDAAEMEEPENDDATKKKKKVDKKPRESSSELKEKAAEIAAAAEQWQTEMEKFDLFAGRDVTRIDEGDVREVAEDLRRRRVSPTLAAELIDGLERGVAVHFRSLPNLYTRAVERLFRARKLRVVISTKTMALGLNMPCRSVVFAGDSEQLNAIQFRQMSGRAGRRGFDLIGSVCFMGVPSPKILRLLTSDVPNIASNVALTPTLLLRAELLNERDPAAFSGPEFKQFYDPEHAMDTSRRLLSDAVFGRDIAKATPVEVKCAKAQARYVAEFLIREKLLHPDGEASAPAMAVSGLSTVDPANLVIASWLNTAFRTHKFVFSHELVSILSQALYRIPLHPWMQRSDRQIQRLKDLPEDFETPVRDFDRRSLGLFTQYARIASRITKNIEREADVLPLSKVEFDASIPEAEEGTLLNRLTSVLLGFRARSPFAATSGRADSFDSLNDLRNNIDTAIRLNTSSVPSLNRFDRRGNTVPVFSHFLEFYTSGSLDVLVAKYGLEKSVFGDAISDFRQSLASLTEVLKSMGDARIAPPELVHLVETVTGELNTKADQSRAF